MSTTRFFGGRWHGWGSPVWRVLWLGAGCIGMALELNFAAQSSGTASGSATTSNGKAALNYSVPYGVPLKPASPGYATILLPFFPTQVANNGAILGSSVRWFQGTVQTLVAPAELDAGSEPHHMNKRGEVVGLGYKANEFGGADAHAIYWPLGPAMAVSLADGRTPLAAPSGRGRLDRTASGADFITEAGAILGSIYVGDNEGSVYIDGCRWGAFDSEASRLGSGRPDGNFLPVYASGANGAGTLIGQHADGSGYFIGQVEIDFLDFEPRKINEQGAVIGRDAFDYFGVDGVYWDGERHDLPGFFACAINNRGDLLGATSGGPALLPAALVPDVYVGKVSDFTPYLVQNFLPAGWVLDNEEGATDLSDNGLIVGTATVRDAQGNETRQGYLLVPAAIAVDANRDGQIALPAVDGSDVTTAAEPFRFWINDDDDNGQDIDGDDTPGAAFPDGQEMTVQGTRDLVDFFPAFLDLQQLLAVLPPTNAVRYKLKHADGNLKFAYTNLSRVDAFKYLKDVNTGRSVQEARVHWLTGGGYDLDPVWLGQLRDGNQGVILVEGIGATDRPLVLSVENADGTALAETRLEISISPVETMFRHLNLHDRNLPGLVGAMSGGAAKTEAMGNPAGFPDTPNSDHRWLIFVHGFNVSGPASRGWNAEMFKRSYWSGSKARFVGVSWFGNPDDAFGPLPADFHLSVRNAMITAPVLAQEINALPGGASTKTVFAHSLGCGIVSSAIADHGMAVGAACLLDAALARECFDGRDPNTFTAENDGMTPADWKGYDPRQYAANWFKLFDPSSDARAALTWSYRFAGASFAVYNFYSSTEDVLAEYTGELPTTLGGVLWDSGTHGSYGWVLQEKGKGARQNYGIVVKELAHLGSYYGGWGFNLTDPADVRDPIYYRVDAVGSGYTERRVLSPNGIPSVTTSTGRELFRRAPLFDPGYGPQSGLRRSIDSSVVRGPNWISTLYDNHADTTTGSATAAMASNRSQLLAEAIPALTWCLGSHASARLPDGRNTNLTSLIAPSNWPRATINSVPEWRHSDLREVAYLFEFQVFDRIVALSNP